MNRRESILTAVAGVLGALWPWGAKDIQTTSSVATEYDPREFGADDCECCQAIVPRDAAISFDGGETWTPVELRL